MLLSSPSLMFAGVMATSLHQIPAGIYLFKINNRNTRTGWKICSKLTIKTPEWCWCLFYQIWTYFTPCSSVYIVNIEHVIAGWDNCLSRTAWNWKKDLKSQLEMQKKVEFMKTNITSSHQRCSVTKDVLKNFKNSQENTCATVSSLRKLQASGVQFY